MRSFLVNALTGERITKKILPSIAKQKKIPLTPEEKVIDKAKRIASLPYAYIAKDCESCPTPIAPPPGHMALDFETYDPTLKEKGSAWAFAGVGRILGIAVAWEGFETYYPLRHAEGNIVNPEAIERWLIDQLNRPDLTIICAKADYDIGWARREYGLYPRGGVQDVQHMGALLNENEISYSLENLSHSYLHIGKEKGLIDEIKDRLKLKYSDVMANLQYIPGFMVAPYGRTDARRTYDLHRLLLEKIKEDNLEKIFKLESSLIPLSVEMRRRGIRVDEQKATELSDDIRLNKIIKIQEKIKNMTGLRVEPWNAESINKAIESIGLYLPRTPKSNQPKVDITSLLALNHGVARDIIHLRKLAKIQGTFLDGHILGHVVNGRVHPEYNQLRAEQDETNRSVGTITGRMSCNSPAIQQLPIRIGDEMDEETKTFVREFRTLFLPENDEICASFDYKQQEPRLTLHYAALCNCRGAIEAVQQFHKNPLIDYHQMTADLCGIGRGPAKTINLALIYGMGEAKLAHKLGHPTIWRYKKVEPLGAKWKSEYDRTTWIDIAPENIKDYVQELIEDGWPEFEAKRELREFAGPETLAILEKWRAGVPFIPMLDKLVRQTARRAQEIITIGGRKCRFPTQGPNREPWGIHKSLNKLIQGSAADQTKQAMLDAWNAGYVPMMQIHDDLVFSISNLEFIPILANFMIEAIPLLVPTIVDIKIGPNFGTLQEKLPDFGLDNLSKTT